MYNTKSCIRKINSIDFCIASVQYIDDRISSTKEVKPLRYEFNFWFFYGPYSFFDFNFRLYSL